MMAKTNFPNGKRVCDPLPIYWLIVTIDEVWYCMEIEVVETSVVVTDVCREEGADDDEREIEDTVGVNDEDSIVDSTEVDGVEVDVAESDDVDVDIVAITVEEVGCKISDVEEI